MKNVMDVMKNSTIFKENVQKLDTICKNLFCKTVFGLMNHKNKFCKNFFLSLIGSTAFKFFRLFDNALVKAYSLYGRRGGKKSFKETKICGVIVSKWVLFIWRFFLLSQKMNWVSSISFLHYESLKKNKLKTYWNLDNKFVFEMY